MRSTTWAIAVLATWVADTNANDSLELLQVHAKRHKSTVDVGDWWPTDCGETPSLKLDTPRYSNLGGVGPDADSPTEIVYPEAGVVDGATVDVVVKSVGDVTIPNPGMNGVKPGTNLGRLSVGTGSEVSLSISLVDSESKEPVTAKFMALTFLDIDEGTGGNGRCTVRVPGATDLFTSATTELSLSDDCTGATSSTKGVGKDNPESVDTLNDLQLRRTVTFIVGSGSSWSATLKVGDPVIKSGRVFMFTLQPVIPCIVDGGSRCGGARPTTTTTTTTTLPTTCGNNCNTGMAYKKCAAWGDPHYTKTFRGAPPNYNDAFNLQPLGVQTLAVTKCNSVEIQTVQCPWHGGGATVYIGFAMRVGSDVMTLIGNTVRNEGGLKIEGGNPRIMTSGDSCVQLWAKTNGGIGTPGRSYYMDMELKMDDPDAKGSCTGDRQAHPTPQADILFTSDELSKLCGHCRFACPVGSLAQLDQSDATTSEAPPVTAQTVCDQAGISYDEADKVCAKFSEKTNHGSDPFLHSSCIMDYCGSEGDPAVVDFEISTETHLEEDDGEVVAAQ